MHRLHFIATGCFFEVTLTYQNGATAYSQRLRPEKHKVYVAPYQTKRGMIAIGSKPASLHSLCAASRERS